MLDDEAVAVEEGRLFEKAGGTSIVEVRTAELARDSEGLKRIAEETGVNIIMASGWYRQPYYPPETDQRSTNDLADEMIRDLTEGVRDSGVEAGIIGEIAAHRGFITSWDSVCGSFGVQTNTESRMPGEEVM